MRQDALSRGAKMKEEQLKLQRYWTEQESINSLAFIHPAVSYDNEDSMRDDFDIL